MQVRFRENNMARQNEPYWEADRKCYDISQYLGTYNDTINEMGVLPM